MVKKILTVGSLLIFTIGTFSMLIAEEKKSKCKDELARICPGNNGDGKKIGECLKDKSKSDSLSPDCKPRKVDFVKIRKECAGEISSGCTSAKTDGDLYMCLRKNQSRLSTGCANSL